MPGPGIGMMDEKEFDKNGLQYNKLYVFWVAFNLQMAMGQYSAPSP